MPAHALPLTFGIHGVISFHEKFKVLSLDVYCVRIVSCFSCCSAVLQIEGCVISGVGVQL